MKADCARKIYPVGFRDEFFNLLKVAWPVILTNLLQFFILTESIIMCGHLDKYQLDGCSLANSILNAIGISVGTGLCTACDTLFSQTYGSKYRERMGIVLQRSVLVISIFPFLLWVLHLNCEPLFIFLGQDPRVAFIAADYMKIFTPGLFFSFHYLILARYLQNQDRVFAPMISGVIGNVFNIGSQYVCIYVFDKGYRASAICQAITYFVMWLTQLLYILLSGVCKETWSGWSTEALYDWGQFVALALPGMGMITMETVSWEIGTFIAGTLGATWLGVQAIVFQLETVSFMISFGLSVAVNIRVGQHLGGQDPERALTAYRVGLTTVLMTSTTMALIFITLNNYLPKIFTDDAEVISFASPIVQLLGMIQIVDGFDVVSAGALRGCGRQNIGACFIFLAYNVFGLPIGISLALATSLKVTGLWVGMFIGLSVSAPCMVLMVNYQNWNTQAANALKRIKGKSIDSPGDLENETASLLEGKDKTKYADDPSATVRHKHRRTTSETFGSSLLGSMYLEQNKLRKRKHILFLRILTYLIVFLLFFGGLLVSLLLPRDLYLPQGQNSTDILISDAILTL